MTFAAPDRPRVLVLSFSPVARDPRVMRQVELLAPRADVVTVGYGPAPAGVVQHVEVPVELAPWRSARVVGPLLLGLRRHHRLYFGSRRIQFVRDAVPAGSMDVVLANDALAVPLALALAPRGGVHADLHEYAPRQGEDRVLWRLLVAPLMRWACRQVSRAASVTTVAPGIAAEYEKRFGWESEVVPNAPGYRAELEPTPAGNPVRLVHVGIAGRARRLEVMIDAVHQVEQRAPGTARFDLYLAPGDEAYIRELAARADTGDDGVVRVLPPVPYEQIVPTLAGYDVGVFICPPTTFNLAHALPNKLFEFVQARLGVLIGPSVEMAAYTRRYGFGAVAAGFDVGATAEAIQRLDPLTVDRLKQASSTHAAELSSERLSRPWLEAVQRLADAAAYSPDPEVPPVAGVDAVPGADE